MADRNVNIEEYPEVPEKYQKYINNPYGGLLGNTVQVQIVEKIIADPDRVYRPRDFKEDLNVSYNSIKKSLLDLTELKLLINVTREKNRPEFKVNPDSKQLWALTFLAYAVLDDRDGTDLMNRNIKEYFNRVISSDSSPEPAMASTTWYKGEFTGKFSNVKVSTGK